MSRYRVLAHLAKGGMGRVSGAVLEEGRFQRLFAIKRLKPELLDDEATRAMFLEEARIAGLVRHPNVVSVLDVGEDDDGPFLVMELVEGLSLSKLVKTVVANGDALPLAVCLEIALHCARALAAAHEAVTPDGESLQVIHRDVSPQNVLIGFDGVARLTDFGVSRASGRTVKTSTGLLKGKIGYMSPEQLSFRPLDQRADLFSFGVVLYEMLAGMRLYSGVDMETTARRILDDPAPDIDDVRKDVPPELVRLLFGLLAKDPDARPQSAAQVATQIERLWHETRLDEDELDLRAYLDTHFAGLREEQSRVRSERLRLAPLAKRRSKRWIWSIGVAAVVLGFGIAFVAWPDPPPAAPIVEPEALAVEPARPAEPVTSTIEPPEMRATAMRTRPTMRRSKRPTGMSMMSEPVSMSMSMSMREASELWDFRESRRLRRLARLVHSRARG